MIRAPHQQPLNYLAEYLSSGFFGKGKGYDFFRSDPKVEQLYIA
jgi:hypothetical protein